MHRPSRRIAVAFVSLSFLLVSTASAGAATRTAERTDRAAGYIASQQNPNGSIPAFSPMGSTADAVLAFVAAGEGRAPMRAALRYLARQVGRGIADTTGLQAKVALAMSAAGEDPRDVAGENLVRTLRQTYTGGGGSPIVFDTALAVLALDAAGAAIPAAATDLLVDEQCPDGGWPFDAFDEGGEDEHCFSGDAGSDFFLSDTNSTALAIMALEAAGVAWASNPFAFLREIRDADHRGWGYSWGFETTDANSTALVLQAFRAAGRAIPASGARALRALQYRRCGAFGFTFEAGERGAPDVGATIGAAPGLRPLAIPFARDVSGPVTDTPACAGA